MNGKITKIKIKKFFTYDLLKVIGICVILCSVFALILSAVEKKATEGQRFTVLYGDDVIIGEEETDFCESLIGGENALSYDVLVFEPKQISSIDSSPEYYLKTYSDLCDDDVFISTESLAKAYVEGGRAQELESYIENAFEYLYDNGFYSANNVINEEAIVKSFADKYSKDARFKKSSDFEKGKQAEISRIKAIFENATVLKEVFKNNPQIFNEEYIEDGISGQIGKYLIDLGKLTGGSLNVSNSYKRRVENEETNEVTYTSNGVYLMLGNKYYKNGDMHYEGLTYLVNFLKTYSNLI